MRTRASTAKQAVAGQSRTRGRCAALLSRSLPLLAAFALGFLLSTLPTPRLPLQLAQASVPRAMSGGAAGPDGTSFVACYVTVPSQDVAEKIAGPLLEQRLAACVNIIPGVQSMYWWQGKVEKDAELLLMIKTRASLVDKLTEAVVALHPYDVCEVISVPITGGNPPYLTWVADSTSAGAAQ